MSDTPIPGGVDPTPPGTVLYRTITQDGRLLGACWVTTVPEDGRLNGGAVTHLEEMPARLAWLGQYLVRGGGPALDELAAMGGLRWQASGVDAVANGLDELRATLEAIAVERGEATLVEHTPEEQPTPSRADLADLAALEAAQAPQEEPGTAVPDTPVEAATADDSGTTKAKRPSGAQQRKAKAEREAAAAAQDPAQEATQ